MATMGRPVLWETPEALQESVEQYFLYCKENERPPTIAGLAYYLDVDRQTIYNYAKKDDFFDIIKKARNRIMMYLEENAVMGAGAGTIFVMKQYGYTDKQEVDTTINSSEFTQSMKRFIDKL